MILIICGPVAVGKTTVAEGLQEALSEKGIEYRMLHSDDFSRETYEQMYEKVEGSPSENWILDGTFYSQEARTPFMSLENVNIVWLKASLETCIERNNTRDEPLEEKALYIMWNEFEEPEADLVIDTENRDADGTVEKILKTLKFT